MTTQSVSSITDFGDRFSRFFSNRPRLCRTLGNLETKTFSAEIGRQVIDRPIFISGLARSDSTILLECLAAHEQTVSHRYRDYPLASIPLWWNRFVDRAVENNHKPVERFHQDGLFVTPGSPEAMEEILWMMFFNDTHRPLLTNVLGADVNHPDFEAFYSDHIRKLLLLRQGSRYLAKNNYLVTRLGYVHKLFPDARFIIPVRNPVDHIASLLRQHRLFCAREQADPKVLHYMRLSGHFEFGLDRRPINTGDTEAVQRILLMWDEGAEVGGWALTWRTIHEFIITCLMENEALREATLIMPFAALCRSPRNILRKLYDHCELLVSDGAVAKQARRISLPDYYQLPFSSGEASAVRDETQDTYQRLLSLSPISVNFS